MKCKRLHFNLIFLILFVKQIANKSVKKIPMKFLKPDIEIGRETATEKRKELIEKVFIFIILFFRGKNKNKQPQPGYALAGLL